MMSPVETRTLTEIQLQSLKDSNAEGSVVQLSLLIRRPDPFDPERDRLTLIDGRPRRVDR